MKDEIKKGMDALRESICKMTRIPLFLVVEDNQIDAELFSRQLKECCPKSQILIANTGEDAIKIFSRQSVDIIFLDLGLPIMDGLQVIKELKKTHVTLDSALVIVTGMDGETEQTVEAIKLGALKVLTKPVKLEDLKSLLGIT